MVRLRKRAAGLAAGIVLAVALPGALSAAVALPGAGAEESASASGGIKPKNGLYRGRTRQGAPVSFRVRRGRVVRPSFTIRRRGCGVRITFPLTRRINPRSRFFFGRKRSDFFTGRFVRKGRVRGRAGVDFGGSSCPGWSVKKVRFRARRVRARQR
jgi:hypothetical protein